MSNLEFDFKKLLLPSFDKNIEGIKNEVYDIYELFKLKYDRYELLKELLDDVAEWEFATGGESVQRGFYSPLLYETMTIGGMNRGKLLKRITSKSKISYRYGFLDNRLLLAMKYNSQNLDAHTYEYIERRDDIEIGIEFGINRGKSDKGYEVPIQIIVTQFNEERIINVRVVQCSMYNNKQLYSWDYSKSWYYYDEKDNLVRIENITGIEEVMQYKDVMVICDELGCPKQYSIDTKFKEKLIFDVSENNKAYYREMFL